MAPSTHPSRPRLDPPSGESDSNPGLTALISGGISRAARDICCWFRGHDWSEWFWRKDRYGMQRDCTRCPAVEYVQPAALRLPRT